MKINADFDARVTLVKAITMWTTLADSAQHSLPSDKIVQPATSVGLQR
jgi:hypothetical protein